MKNKNASIGGLCDPKRSLRRWYYFSSEGVQQLTANDHNLRWKTKVYGEYFE